MVALLPSSTLIVEVNGGNNQEALNVSGLLSGQQLYVGRLSIFNKSPDPIVFSLSLEDGDSAAVGIINSGITIAAGERYVETITPFFLKNNDRLLLSSPVETISSGYSAPTFLDWSNLNWFGTSQFNYFEQAVGSPPFDVLITSGIDG